MNLSFFTMKNLYENALNKYSDKLALIFQNRKMTYGELRLAANRFAHAIRKEGVQNNTGVALLMPNCIEFVISDIGIHLAGAVKVPLNAMLSEKEIEYILKDSKAKIAVIDEMFIETILRIKANLPDLGKVVVVGEMKETGEGFVHWEEFLQDSPDTNIPVQVSPNDRGLIAYTGGTTGLPKGVVHSQRNLVMNILSHQIEIELQEDERYLIMTPLTHGAGMVMQATLMKGAVHFIEKEFHPEIAVERIQKDKATITFMVPTMIYRILDYLSGKEFDGSSMRTIVYGAAPIAEERLKQGLEIFGPVFLQIYGQTEAPNFITKFPREDHLKRKELLKSCGKPAYMVQVKIVDEFGKEVPPGVAGEIIAKTPYNMIEYLNNEEKTKETLKDGWLFTGDIGKKDEDGYIYLLDRKNDMIITGGMNVYSTEVENALHLHPDIKGAAVIGIPDPDWGEAVAAVVIPREGSSIDENQIIRYCKENLAKYKVPKKVYCINEFPLTPYGKIDKKQLRKQFMAHAGS